MILRVLRAMNRGLEHVNGRIPTDVELWDRVLQAEAEREVLLAENKRQRDLLAAKVKKMRDDCE